MSALTHHQCANRATNDVSTIKENKIKNHTFLPQECFKYLLNATREGTLLPHLNFNVCGAGVGWWRRWWHGGVKHEVGRKKRNEIKCIDRFTYRVVPAAKAWAGTSGSGFTLILVGLNRFRACSSNMMMMALCFL